MSESDVAEGPYYVNTAVSVSVTLLIIISATLLVTLLLLWFRKERGKRTKLVDNVAYNIQDCEIETDPNEAYNAVETNVITTTNAAYGATSVQSTQMSVVDITTVTNESTKVHNPRRNQSTAYMVTVRYTVSLYILYCILLHNLHYHASPALFILFALLRGLLYVDPD